MSDLYEDSDLFGEDYRQKDDDLEDDLDDQLLYSSEEEKDEKSVPEPASLTKSNQEKQSSDNVVSETSDYTVESNTIVNQHLSKVNGSDSEGTDTRDETDDRPLNGDDTTRKKIKIYRRISNVPNQNQTETLKESSEAPAEEISQLEPEISVHYDDEDSDGDEKGKRGRFRSERDDKTSDIGPKRRRNSGSRNIPDTLEISQEDQQKIEEFNKQQKEKRFNKRGFGRRGASSQQRFPRKGSSLFSNLIQRQAISNPPRGPVTNSPFPQSILGNPPPNVWPLIRQPLPPQIPISIPPPHWLGPRNFPPPPILSVQSMGSLINTQAIQTATITAQAPIIQPPVPAVAPAGKTENSNLNSSQQSQGNPIPTVMSVGKREAEDERGNRQDSKIRRQAMFDNGDRSSPKLSVKITRSRSKSPIPRNSKRIVLKPRKSRSRSPKLRSSRRREKSPKKRSRRRSRSYSPRRRSRSRSYSPKRRSPSPRRKPQNSSKPGKILINPHFKGARKLPATALQTTAATTSIVNPKMLFSFPPPPLPGVNPLPSAPPAVNVNVPPPSLPAAAANPPSTIARSIKVPPPVVPPNISIPPPIAPLQTPPSAPSSLNTRPPSLVAPPLLPPRPNVPPPILPPPSMSQVIVSDHQGPPGAVGRKSAVGGAPIRPPIVIDPTRPPPPINSNIPPRVPAPAVLFAGSPPLGVTRPPFRPVIGTRGRFPADQTRSRPPHVAPISQPGIRHAERGPSVFIRSAFNDNKTSQKFNNSSDTSATIRSTVSSGQNMGSRLKPPPTSVPKRNSSSGQNWKNDVNVGYEEQLKRQAEKRKQILQLKAQRRGKDEPNNPLVAVIRGTSPLPVVCSVKITNIASATSQDSISRLMKNIGPIDSLKYLAEEKCFIGSFKSAVHAKEFAEKYNRYMLDLSYISISLAS